MEYVFSSRVMLSFLLMFWMNKSTHAQEICSWDNPVSINENNSVNEVVVTITTVPGVTLTMIEPINTNFALTGNDVIATQVLDYETDSNQIIAIQCQQGDLILSKNVIITVQNINDNPPVFSQNQYFLSVNELTPIGTSVGEYVATDADRDRLYYTLDPETVGFGLQTPTIPKIITKTVLDYDKVKTVSLTLYARDTPTPLPDGEPSYTATATILVTIDDVDNRPPWFQPCTPTTVGTSLICVNSGYTGEVSLTVQEVGALSLKPGPVHAIDGDVGINENITYTFLSGNEGEIFEINANTGSITMTKPVDVAGPLILTVLAAQKKDNDKFATATVTLEVVKKSLHPPQFEKAEYEGFISTDAGLGSLVLEGKTSTKPLRILATDADFAGGVNPDVTYEVVGTSDFSATPQGFILLAKDLSSGTVSIQLSAIDSSNKESSTATLVVEITAGIPSTTTMAPISATDITTIDITSDTSHVTNPSTTNPSMTTQDNHSSTSSASTAGPYTEGVVSPGGNGFSVVDMAALGASLAVLLILCIVIIGLLIFQLHKGKADWRKLSEASIFRSAIVGGSNGPKEGVQYTNEGFQNDEDTSSTGSHTQEVAVRRGSGPGTKVGDLYREEDILKASAPLHTILPDNTSLEGSDKADSEKEVKPILTKERRVEEGYKSVWFKEDIDPNAKEEVVIIPENGERDGDDDEEGGSLGSGEEEDDSSRPTQRVIFTNADEDSGLGGQSNQESDDDDDLQTSDL